MFIQSKQAKGSQPLVKGGMAGIQLPPMQGKAQGTGANSAESMYDATGQLKIKSLASNHQQQMLTGGNSMKHILIHI